jgi:hypothetical protein
LKILPQFFGRPASYRFFKTAGADLCGCPKLKKNHPLRLSSGGEGRGEVVGCTGPGQIAGHLANKGLAGGIFCIKIKQIHIIILKKFRHYSCIKKNEA